jgi:predicted transcriptional regulator
VPVSKPMQVVAFRFTDEERQKLEELARERNVSMSWVIRQGLRLYAEDARAWLDERSSEDVLTA